MRGAIPSRQLLPGQQSDSSCCLDVLDLIHCVVLPDTFHSQGSETNTKVLHFSTLSHLMPYEKGLNYL